MKRLLLILLIALLISVGLVVTVGRMALAAPPLPPAPTEWVTDTDGFLTPTTRQTLNARLGSYEEASGHQVLVWIGKTTEEMPTEEWAARTFEKWWVGRKGIDDGLVLFILTEDRAARIEVGYGLEEQVSDAVASRILADDVIPRIKAGDNDGAVTTAVGKLIAAIGGTDISPGTTPSAFPQSLGWFPKLMLGLLVVLGIVLMIRYPTLGFFILSLLTSGNGRGNNGGGRWFSGGGGRSGGGGATGRW